ncbi:hypothetical protein GF361_04395, partial [Candidatus Woesearchaeota archaeon]|nr:hypothetical protein [Candidatus Woesearchaeota archaeon]
TCEADNDGDNWSTTCGDCNDFDNNTYLGATELCDGIDNDCNFVADETFTDDNCIFVCLNNSYNWSGNGGSLNCCGDDANEAFPYEAGNEFSCFDFSDNDCDGLIDHGSDPDCNCTDADGDGYNVSWGPDGVCGTVLPNTYDCDDNDNTTYPGATEVCNNKDDNCINGVDEGFDNDLDGFTSCDSPVPDCDDTNASINPNATEVCNGVDDDCDGNIDEGVLNNYYNDTDGDNYGNNSQMVQVCSNPGGIYVATGGDCDDTNASINPNATEICNNIDDDCDSVIDEGFDNDNDNYTVCDLPIADCNDTDNKTYPGATEKCGDGKDNDCDGKIDEGCGNGGGGGGGGGDDEEEEKEDEEDEEEEEKKDIDVDIPNVGDSGNTKENKVCVSFENTGNVPLQNVKIEIEQPEVEREMQSLYSRTFSFDWDQDMETESIIQDPRELEWSISRPAEYNNVGSGEKIGTGMGFLSPLSLKDSEELKLRITADGREVYTKTITYEFDETEFIVMGDKREGINLVDVYVLIRNNKNIDRKFNVEFNINEEEDEGYKGSSSLYGLVEVILYGKNSQVSKYLGPYPVAAKDAIILGYRYAYNEDKFDDVFPLEATLYEGFEELATYKGKINLNEDRERDEEIKQELNKITDECRVKIDISPPIMCIDSDGGEDYFVRGSVIKDGWDEIDDFCIGDNRLSEAICNVDGNPSFAEHNCMFGCEKGACIRRPFYVSCNRTYKTSSSIIPCNPKDCGEDRYIRCDRFKRGSGMFRLTAYSEICAGIYNTECSMDASCKKGEQEIGIFECTLDCSDSDGGKNFYEKGKINGTLMSGPPIDEDICVGDDIRELFCNEEGFGEPMLHTCEYGCENGACNCSTNMIGEYTIREGTSVDIVGEKFNFTLVNLSTNTGELKYQIPFDNGGLSSGNIALGSIDLNYQPLIRKYMIINPVFRNSTHAVFRIMETQGIGCLNESCEDYCYVDMFFSGGEYYSWMHNVERAICHRYKAEYCSGGCENNTCYQVNEKNMSKYSDKELFLVSDNDWKNVLPLVPVTTWTSDNLLELQNCKKGYGTEEDVCVYPSLVYHEEDSGFDADSIIYFMQQYNPDKVTIVGNTPAELDDLLTAAKDFGAGLQKSQIKRITPNSYLSYWSNVDKVVYVEDSYESALSASTYASLINSPLIIEGSVLDSKSILSGKDLICVGDDVYPAGSSCTERYNLSEMQQKYADKTGTDKMIIVNPDDFDVLQPWNEEFNPDKSGSINNLYYKDSVAAPFLAAAKKEVLLSTNLRDEYAVESFILNQADRLGLDIKYLTIAAGPRAIDMTYVERLDDNTPSRRYSADVMMYSNIDEDHFIDLSVGRIFGITVSDSSSNIARSLFYDETLKNNESVLVTRGSPYITSAAEVYAMGKIMEVTGYDTKITPNETTPEDWKDKFFISYNDHGASSWAGIDSDEIPYLDNSFIPTLACSTCDFEGAFSKQELFCANAIRKGAVGYIGATDASGYINIPDIINELFTHGSTIGQAFINSKNNNIASRFYNYGLNEEVPKVSPWFFLLGDPTLKLKTVYKMPEPQLNMKGNDDYSLVVPVMKIDIPENIKNMCQVPEQVEPLYFITGIKNNLDNNDYFIYKAESLKPKALSYKWEIIHENEGSKEFWIKSPTKYENLYFTAANNMTFTDFEFNITFFESAPDMTFGDISIENNVFSFKAINIGNKETGEINANITVFLYMCMDEECNRKSNPDNLYFLNYIEDVISLTAGESKEYSFTLIDPGRNNLNLTDFNRSRADLNIYLPDRFVQQNYNNELMTEVVEVR